MKKFIKLIPVFLLLCLISFTVNAQDSTSLCLEELNTDVYEDILTNYYEVETGYAYCSSAVNLTSSVEITEDVTVTIRDAYGSNVWRVDTSLDAADSNCAVVELNNVFYYLSTVSNPVFTDEGVTFSTNKLGIYIAGGCFSEEDIENFSTGTSNFSIDESTLTQVGTWLGAPYALLDNDGDGVNETVYVYGTITDTTEITSLTYETYGFYKVLADNPVVTKAIINCSLGSRTSARSMFDNCENLDSLIFRENFDTSQVINMRDMFSDCGKSSTSFTLDLGTNFNTSNVTNMQSMFYGCGSSSTKFTLDLGEKFNTSKVTSMYGMFNNCGKSSTSFTLNLGNNFNTSSVTSMTYMFAWCGYSSTKFTLDLGVKFDTSKVTKMDYMFAYCGDSSTVFTLDLGDNFNTSNVTNMGSMFNSCGSSSTKFTLDLGEKFNTSKVTTMTSMFAFCGESNPNFELDLSSFDMSKVTSYTSFFNYNSLKTLKTPKVCPITNIAFPYEMVDEEGVSYSNLPVTTGISKTLIKPKDMVVTVTNGQAVETGEPIAFNGQINVEDPSTGYTIEYGESSVQELTINAVNDTYGFDKVNDEYVSNNKGVHSSEAKTTFSITAEKDVTLQVNYNVSSEASYDIFKLTLDGTDVLSGMSGYNKGGLSGTYSGTLDLPLTAGEHTLIAIYKKDSSGNTGNDTVRISLSGFEMLWSTNVPTKTEAGTYKIPFRIKALCYNIYEGNVNFVIEEPTVYVTIDGKEYQLTKDGEWLGASYSLLDTDEDGTKETCYVYGTMTNETIIYGCTVNTSSRNYDTLGFYKVLSDNPTVTKAIINCSLGNRTSTRSLFDSCSNLISLQFSENFDTSNVTSMYDMFYGCSSLTTLDVSNFDTSNVTRMDSMFSRCSSLKTLDVSHFNTSKVTNIFGMFSSCSSLTSLNVSNFVTSKVTDMSSMFNGCSSLTSLDVSNFNTSNVTRMSWMFYNCKNLTTLDLSNFNTSKVTSMDHMFYLCSKLTTLNISSFVTSNVTSMCSMFCDCSSLTSIDVSNFVTSKVTDMSSMFKECQSLTLLDVSNFNTSKVTTMSDMFYKCSKLTSLNVSNFDTCSVTKLDWMFSNCSSLATLDVSNFNTSKVTLLNQMFENCSSLTSLDISNFNTSNVTSTSFMFSGCQKLTTLNLSNFDTSNVTNIAYMFQNCLSLLTLNLSNFDLSKVTDASSMFYNCTKLNKIILPNNISTTSIVLPATFYGYASDATIPDRTKKYTTLPVKDTTTGLSYISTVKYPAIEALLRNVNDDTYFLGVEDDSFRRENIASVTFSANSTSNMSNVFDVSLYEDEGVLTYAVSSPIQGLYDIHVVTRFDKFYTNENAEGGAKGLFKNLYNCTNISGFEYLDLSRSSSADNMFSGYAPIYVESPSTYYSHSENVDDNGNSISNTYSNNLKVIDTISVPGAAKLEITITLKTESTKYDWVAIYPGNVTPTATNYSQATVSNGKIGGTTKSTKTYTYVGDSINIFFRTDGSGNKYYGYYAVITAYDSDNNVFTPTLDISKKMLDLKNLSIPEGISTVDFFKDCSNFRTLRTPYVNNKSDIELGSTMYSHPDGTAYELLPKSTGKSIILYNSAEDYVYCNNAETICGKVVNNTLTLSFVENVNTELAGCYDLDIPLTDLFYPDEISSIDMSNIDGCLSICDNWAKNVTINSELSIPDSVTTIGSYAFEGAGDSTGSLHLPSSIVTIGSYAFSKCDFSNGLNIPNSCTTLGADCFSESKFNGGLTTGGLTVIPDYCFSNATFNGDIDLSGIITIKTHAFIYLVTNGSLIFSDSIKDINDFAFGYSSGFTGDLVIPSTVRILGDYAFRDCSNSWLGGELWLSEGLQSIGKHCFQNCTGFVGNIDIPDTVTTIKSSAFYFSGNDTAKHGWQDGSINIGKNVSSIESYAFANLRDMKGDLILPDSITSLGQGAFQNVYSNGTLSLGYGIRSIASDTFENTNFETIILRGKLTGISDNSFLFNNLVYTGDANNIVNDEYLATTVYCHADDTVAREFDWYNNAKRDVTFVDLPYYLNTSNTLIGELDGNTLSIIGDGNELDIPLRAIFNDFTSITTLDWTQATNVTTIGYTWAQSTKLTGDLILPDTITEIQSNAFYAINSFTGELHLPQNLQTIGNDAFYNCRGFTGDIIIPNSCKSIGANAFMYLTCTGDLMIPDTCCALGQMAFYYSEIGGDVYIGRGIKTIPTNCFYYSKIGGNITIAGAIVIGPYAFGYTSCNGTLDLGDFLKEIGDGAFYYVSNFTGDLTIPGTVTKMGSQCFSKPKSDAWVGSHLIIEEGCQVIGYSCFNNCDNFVGDIVIPGSVKRIENMAFYNGSNTENPGWKGGKLILNEGIESIGAYAFSCMNLLETDVIIPESCNSIGDYAFNNLCTPGKLKLPKSVENINSSTFYSTYFNDLYFENDYTLNGNPFYFYNNSRKPLTGEYLDSTGNKLLTTVHCSHNHTNLQSADWASMYREVTFDFYDKYLNTAETILGRIMDDGTLNIYYDVTKDTSAEGYYTIDKTLVSVFGEETKNITNIVFDGRNQLTLCDSWCDNREGDFSELLGVYNLSHSNIYGAYCFADCQNTLFIHGYKPDDFNKPADGETWYAEYQKERVKHSLCLYENSSVAEGSFMNCYQIYDILNERYYYQDGVQDWYNAFSCDVPMSTRIEYIDVTDDTNMQGYKYWSTVGRYPVYHVVDPEDETIMYFISTLQKECKVMALPGENTILQSKLSNLFDDINMGKQYFDMFDTILFESDSSDSYINWFLDYIVGRDNLGHVTGIPADWANGAYIDYVELPEQCVSIGDNAFNLCHATNTLTFPSTLRSLGVKCFGSSDFTGDLILPEGITEIPNECFQFTKFNGTLGLPSTVTSIGEYAFANSKVTGNLNLPENLTTLGKYAFSNSKLSGDIVISEGITTLPECCFDYSAFKGTLQLPSNLISIGDNCFNSTYIKLNQWPVTLQTIGAYALSRATIRDGKLPDSLRSIGDKAFYAANLEDFLIIPEDIQSIGNRALNSCSVFWYASNLEATPEMFGTSERLSSLFMYTPERKSFDWTSSNYDVCQMNELEFAFPDEITLKPKYVSGKDAPIWTTTVKVNVTGHFTRNSYANILEAVDFYITNSAGKKVLVDVDYTPQNNVTTIQSTYNCNYQHAKATTLTITLTADDLSLVDRSTGELTVNYELHEMIPLYTRSVPN